MSEVLVIDDETVLARAMVSFLERRGFPSVYAVDGVSAKAMFQREQPRLVILDYKLNEDDGLELLEWILESDPRTQIVMMTGHGDVGVAVRAMKAGARDFIVKPASQTPLSALALSVLAERAMPKGEVTAADMDGLIADATSEAGEAPAEGKDAANKLVADLQALKAALGL